MKLIVCFLFVFLSRSLVFGQISIENADEGNIDTTLSKEQLISTFLEWLPGEYSNQSQSEGDSVRFPPYNMVIVPILKKTDESGKWFYVEQRILGKPESVRQRVFKVYQSDLYTIVISLYGISNAERFIDAKKMGSKATKLSMSDLITKQFCDIRLQYKSGQFQGKMDSRNCSIVGGAKYYNVTLNLSNAKLELWEKAFNDSDVQIWGNKSGAYLFDKIGNLE